MSNKIKMKKWKITIVTPELASKHTQIKTKYTNPMVKVKHNWDWDLRFEIL